MDDQRLIQDVLSLSNHPPYLPFSNWGFHLIPNFVSAKLHFKGIVSRDFGGLQMILMNRIGVPDVPLEVYSFLNFRFYIDFSVQRFERVKLLLILLANA